MDRRRGPGGPFFNSGDPFAGFGGFGGAGSPGDFMSSFFGGRSPFDDPFFTRPFGSMLQPSFLGGGGPFPFPNFPQGGFLEDQVQPNGAGGSFPFPSFPQGGFLEDQVQPNGAGGFPFPNFSQGGFPGNQVQPKRPRGPIIEEINSESDDEIENNGDQKNVKSRKQRSSNTGKEPYVEYPDEVEERKRKQVHRMDQINLANNGQTQPQAQSFSYQSSSFTYSGANGAYYTSSKARRIGSDGLTFEERKEADSTTGEASHHISRGLYDKGHSLSRKLKSDGKVNTMQTLHNLDEGELHGFEAAWHGKAKREMPQLAQSFSNPGFIGSGNRQIDEGSHRGWALPSTEPRDQSRRHVHSVPAEQQPRRMIANAGMKNNVPSMSKNIPSNK